MKLQSDKRRYHHRRRQSSAVPAPPIDWAAIIESLPQEPPKKFADIVWNGYKRELWGKFKPDSLVGFEILRMAAKSSDMPEGLRLVSNFLAFLCAVDGYGATVEGLRRDEEQKRPLARI